MSTRRSQNNKIFLPAVMAVLILAALLIIPAQPVSATFEYTPITIKIPFTVSEKNIKDKETYDVVIEPLDSSFPQPVKDVISVEGGSSASFEIVADEPGTYGYRICERKGSDKDITYDDRSYEVTVFVTSDDDGNLEYQIVLSDGSSVKPTSVKFVNTSEEDKPDITPTTKPSNPDPITRTGEVLSKYLPYGLIAIALGAGIIIFVIIRRRRDKAS